MQRVCIAGKLAFYSDRNPRIKRESDKSRQENGGGADRLGTAGKARVSPQPDMSWCRQLFRTTSIQTAKARQEMTKKNVQYSWPGNCFPARCRRCQ